MLLWGGLENYILGTSCAVTEKSSLLQFPSCIPTIPPPILPSSGTAIDNTSTSGFYLTPSAPCANIKPAVSQILVGTAGGPPHQSYAPCDLPLPSLTVSSGHMIPNVHNNLMGIGKLCDHDCQVMFKKWPSQFLAKILPSSSEGGVKLIVTSFGGLPSTTNITHQSQLNENIVMFLSIQTTSLSSDPSYATSMWMMDSHSSPPA